MLYFYNFDVDVDVDFYALVLNSVLVLIPVLVNIDVIVGVRGDALVDALVLVVVGFLCWMRMTGHVATSNGHCNLQFAKAWSHRDVVKVCLMLDLVALLSWTGLRPGCQGKARIRIRVCM